MSGLRSKGNFCTQGTDQSESTKKKKGRAAALSALLIVVLAAMLVLPVSALAEQSTEVEVLQEMDKQALLDYFGVDEDTYYTTDRWLSTEFRQGVTLEEALALVKEAKGIVESTSGWAYGSLTVYATDLHYTESLLRQSDMVVSVVQGISCYFPNRWTIITEVDGAGGTVNDSRESTWTEYEEVQFEGINYSKEITIVSDEYYVLDKIIVNGTPVAPAITEAQPTDAHRYIYRLTLDIREENPGETWNYESIVKVSFKQQYSLKFDANVEGEDIAVPETQIADAGMVTIPAEKPVREGYLFYGWNTSSDGSGKRYLAGKTFDLGQHATLYAQWVDLQGLTEAEMWEELNYQTMLDYFGRKPGVDYKLGEVFASFTPGVTLEEAYALVESVQGSARFLDDYKSISLVVTAPDLRYTIEELWASGKVTHVNTNGYFFIPETWFIYSYVDGWGGTVNGSRHWSLQQVYYFTSDINYIRELTIVSDEDYVLDKISINGLITGPDTVEVHPDSPNRFIYHYTLDIREVNPDYRFVDTMVTVTFKQQYVVDFDANAGDDLVALPERITIDKGSALALPIGTPTREGYTFTGWNTAADGSGQSYLPGSLIVLTEHMTLYAQWTASESISFTIRYLDAVTNKDLLPPKTQEGFSIGMTVRVVAPDIPGYTAQVLGGEMLLEADGQEFVFYYVLKGHVFYTVRHLESSTYAEVAPPQLLWGKPNTILTPEALDLPGYAKDYGNWGWIKEGAVFTVFYTRNVVLPYTIYYIDWQTGKEIAPAVQTEGTYQSFTSAAFGAKPAVTGYTPRGSYSWSGKQWTEANTHYIKLYYNKDGISYTVRYLDAATGSSLMSPKTVHGKALGEAITEEAPVIAGYNPQSPTKQFTLDADNKEVIFLYSSAGQVSYTVRHIETATNRELAPAQTFWGKPNTILTPEALSITGYAKDYANWGWIKQGAVFTVYYTTDLVLPYTVYYVNEVTGEEIAPAKVTEGSYQDFVNTAFGQKPEIDSGSQTFGYSPLNCYSWSGKQWTAENTHYIKLYYAMWMID